MAVQGDLNLELQELNDIKGKLAQGINIRRMLVAQKLRLFENFEALAATQRLVRLQDFLQRYERLYNREVRITDLFRRGIDLASKVLRNSLPVAGPLRNEIKGLINVYNEVDVILSGYERRMVKEDNLLRKTESKKSQVEMVRNLHDEFKLEVAGDLKVVMNLRATVTDVKRIKEQLDAKLGVMRRAQTLTGVGGVISLGGGHVFAYSGETVLWICSAAVGILGIMTSVLIFNTSQEEERLLADLARFDSVSKMSFH